MDLILYFCILYYYNFKSLMVGIQNIYKSREKSKFIKKNLTHMNRGLNAKNKLASS